MAEVTLKQFRELYPDSSTFNAKITTPLIDLFPVKPDYLDESKTYYSFKAIYTMLFNKYSEFYAINEEEKQHQLMQNALLHLLPTLYIRTKALSNEALGNLNPDNLLASYERYYNEDADNKYASTETTYSSTPDDSQNSGTFNLENVREKNITNRKDLTVRRREMINLIDKLTSLSKVNVSGHVLSFVNSMEISSLWRRVPADETTLNVNLSPSLLSSYFNADQFRLVNNRLELAVLNINVIDDYSTLQALEKITSVGRFYTIIFRTRNTSGQTIFVWISGVLLFKTGTIFTMGGNYLTGTNSIETGIYRISVANIIDGVEYMEVVKID